MAGRARSRAAAAVLERRENRPPQQGLFSLRPPTGRKDQRPSAGGSREVALVRRRGDSGKAGRMYRKGRLAVNVSIRSPGRRKHAVVVRGAVDRATGKSPVVHGPTYRLTYPKPRETEVVHRLPQIAADVHAAPASRADDRLPNQEEETNLVLKYLWKSASSADSQQCARRLHNSNGCSKGLCVWRGLRRCLSVGSWGRSASRERLPLHEPSELGGAAARGRSGFPRSHRLPRKMLCRAHHGQVDCG